MTIEEAIEYGIEYGKEHLEMFDGKHRVFIEIAMYALDKQIPKRVHKNYDGLSARWCKCGGYVDTPMNGYKYCPWCGQAIDWSDK